MPDHAFAHAPPKAKESVGPEKRSCCSGARHGSCAECRTERLPGLSVSDALRSPGHPLDITTRSSMEPRFGHDFGAVRVHTDAAAAAAASALRARAFTVGQHVAFASGEYKPASRLGRRLIAHELAHTIQQRATPFDGRPSSPLTLSPGASETEADDAADVALQGGRVTSLTPRSMSIARQVVSTTGPEPTPLPAKQPTPSLTDFLINRVGRSTASRIFFARAVAVLSTEAMSEIAAMKASGIGSVRLIGYASADESAALAQARADAVKTALSAAPNPVVVTTAVGNAAATADRSDFVDARSVEILVGAAAPSTVDCGARDSAGKLVNPPKQPCPVMDPATWTAFNAALPLAQDAMARAVASVAGVPAATDADIIDRFFGNHAAPTLTHLRTNLGNLKTHVGNLSSITGCGGQCDTGLCGEGNTIAYNDGVDAASTMTLCVGVFKHMNINDQVRNLIHESAHGTSPLGGTPSEGTADVAYRHERMLFQLSPADRLRNSDSYALFALFLREAQTTGDPKAIPSGIQTPAADNLVGFASTPAGSKEQSAVRSALAVLEKRLTWTTQSLEQLYGTVAAVRTGAGTWSSLWGQDVMTAASTGFPLTAPPGAPTLTDQTRIAGILDRYRRMRQVAKQGLTVSRTAAGVTDWTPAPPTMPTAGTSFEVGPLFFGATPENQASLLLEHLAKQTPEIEAAFVPAYVSLARWIHKQNP